MLQKSEYRVSRYVSYFLYLSKEELDELLPAGIYATLGKVMPSPFLTKSEFLSLEENKGKVGFALSQSHFSLLEVGEKGVIVTPKKPLVEMEPFRFQVTSEGAILEDEGGKMAVSFGIAIRYPSLYEEGKEVVRTKDHFEEAKLFHGMRAFIRKYTVVPKMLVRGKRVNVSFRVGKKALASAKKELESVEGIELE